MTSLHRRPGYPDHDLLGHAHVADLEACLDLINTVELTDGSPTDHLATAADAVGFFVQRGLAHEESLRAEATARPAAWLARIHAARAALREVWDALVEHRPARPADVETVNAWLRQSPVLELRPGAAGVGVGHRHARDATTEALARSVQPLVEAIASGETSRFRICANDGCRWVFRDESRAGRRRWCDMTTCGNRAKVRRYRSRRRAVGDGAAAGEDAAEAGRAAGGTG